MVIFRVGTVGLMVKALVLEWDITKVLTNVPFPIQVQSIWKRSAVEREAKLVSI